MSKQLIITLIEAGLDDLERTARAVPDDKLNWKPLDNGRSIFDLLREAAQMPVLSLHLLQSPDNFNPFEMFPQLMQDAQSWTRDECLAKLRANTYAAIEAIRTTPDDKLEEMLTLPMMGSDQPLSLGAWVMLLYRTFVSRFAQINYIQTLYGDFEFH